MPPPNFVSFSTPMTATTSHAPLFTAIQACAKADELDEHAFSTLMIGMPESPSAFATRWPASMPPSAVPQ